MKRTVTLAAALTMAWLDLGSAPAWAQATTTPTPAPAPAPSSAPGGATEGKPAAAAEAAPPTSPVSMPAMSGTLAGNVKPMKIDAGPLLGDVYITGVLSGMAQYSSNFFFADEHRNQVDLTNGQVVVQKVDGPIQFYLQGGSYSLPDIGVPYLRSGQTVSATFGGLPVWFLKWAPDDAFSVQAGDLPTLIGAEYAFSFQNVNVQRGLIWNQENIINRGVQANYTVGPLALSVAWSDGYFSNRYSWLTGLATYTIDPSNSVAFSAGGSINTETVSSFATPLLQNNSTIYNLVFTHTSGPLTIIPTLQYTTVPADTQLGTRHSLNTYGGGLYGIYTLDGGYSVAGRAEYIKANGNASDPNLLYGPGSNAWSFTVTPTWQNKFLFARGEFSFVRAGSTTPGFAFGPTGTSSSQTRAIIETGIIF
ncbi:MAG TPA: outer membrane beta-barrel protein [Burkholderiaceae bacterium]|nr:outer membrane beta-barrel protein [Burkholderiaceae bacterium]